jgi:hypothetical protein
VERDIAEMLFLLPAQVGYLMEQFALLQRAGKEKHGHIPTVCHILRKQLEDRIADSGTTKIQKNNQMFHCFRFFCISVSS